MRVDVQNWHTRGYLPHFDDGSTAQLITYRLADSLPVQVIARLREKAQANRAAMDSVDHWLDRGVGSCVLRHNENARAVIDGFKRFDSTRYRLVAWVVMPNHVHVLIEPNAGFPVREVVKSWKSYTAKVIMAQKPRTSFQSSPCRVWQPEYWDRFIRNEQHLRRAIEYIHQNPVAARLIDRAEDWPWSSARDYIATVSALDCSRL